MTQYFLQTVKVSIFLIVFSLFSLPMAHAIETSTTSQSNWKVECQNTASLARNAPNLLVNIVKAKQTLNSKTFKIDSKKLNHVLEVISLNCDQISEEFWVENGEEIKVEIQKSMDYLLELTNKIQKETPITITCYKSGVVKTISGKNPVCPKGYKIYKK